MKKIILLSIILNTTVVHWALGDAPVAVVPAQSRCPMAFQGLYVGGNIGYGIGWVQQKFNRAFTNWSVRNTSAIKGVDGGGGIGYTHRLSNWALGLAFDANWTGAKGKTTYQMPLPFGLPPAGYKFTTQLKNSLQLYARLGYALREIAMPFVALGWDNSQWKQTVVVNPGTIAPESVKKNKRLNALLWKCGVDFLATKHIVVGFEYTGTIAKRQKYRAAQTGQFTQGDVLSGSFQPHYNKFALTAKIVY